MSITKLIKQNQVFKIGFVFGYRYYLKLNGGVCEISLKEYEEVLNDI